jgi:hypothetical protein
MWLSFRFWGVHSRSSAQMFRLKASMIEELPAFEGKLQVREYSYDS